MYRGLRFCSTVIILVGILVSLPLFFLGGTSLLSAIAMVGLSRDTASSNEQLAARLAEAGIDPAAIELFIPAATGAIAGGIGMVIAFGLIAAGLFSFALASFAGFGGLALADIAENSRKTLLAIQTA